MSTQARVCLIGAGGHAKVVLDAIQRSDPNARVEIRDDDGNRVGELLLSIPLQVPALPDDGFSSPTHVHVCIGNNTIRAKMLNRALDAGGAALTVVHPRASLAAEAIIGDGSFIASGAIIGPSASVGRGCIINHNAIVDHDCTVADWTHIAPGSVLGGAARIGARSLIGAGAVVLPGRRIGNDCTVGAGAVVVHDIADGTTVTGVPARSK